MNGLFSYSIDIYATLDILSCCSSSCGVIEQVIDHLVVANVKQNGNRSVCATFFMVEIHAMSDPAILHLHFDVGGLA